MPPRVIKLRTRFFVAVEGSSEQSLVRWLQTLSDEANLHIHLDAIPLDGGGFKSMLNKAIMEHKNASRKGAYHDRFLIVDQDRAEQGDWPIGRLRSEAAKNKFTVFVQTPNHEGLLFRMLPGKERKMPPAPSAEKS